MAKRDIKVKFGISNKYVFRTFLNNRLKGQKVSLFSQAKIDALAEPDVVDEMRSSTLRLHYKSV